MEKEAAGRFTLPQTVQRDPEGLATEGYKALWFGRCGRRFSYLRLLACFLITAVSGADIDVS